MRTPEDDGLSPPYRFVKLMTLTWQPPAFISPLVCTIMRLSLSFSMYIHLHTHLSKSSSCSLILFVLGRPRYLSVPEGL